MLFSVYHVVVVSYLSLDCLGLGSFPSAFLNDDDVDFGFVAQVGFKSLS